MVAAADLYGATYALLERTFTSLGVRVRFVDITDLDQVGQAIADEQPVAVLCEIISNPLMKVADVPALADMAHSAGAALIVDTTFASPYLFHPLEQGADYAVHSATKYLAGHGDVMAGVVACQRSKGPRPAGATKAAGRQPGTPAGMAGAARPQDAAPADAPALRQCPDRWPSGWLDIRPWPRCNYPGLPDHPQHAVAARLFGGRGFGGMVSFDLRDAGQAGGLPLSWRPWNWSCPPPPWAMSTA